MNVTLGENATFTVLANFGSRNLKFQWLHDEIKISKEGNSSVLTLVDVTKMNQGRYSCIIYFQPGRSITSKEAQLFICK